MHVNRVILYSYFKQVLFKDGSDTSVKTDRKSVSLVESGTSGSTDEEDSLYQTTNSAVKQLSIHGRTPINREVKTRFLPMLYDLIFESDATPRRLRGLIRPFCVMVKGPGENALVTPMSYGSYAYASPEMLSIEQEAVALLSQ